MSFEFEPEQILSPADARAADPYLVQRLSEECAELGIPERLANTLTTEEAVVHRALEVAFEIRLPGNRETSLSLNNGVGISRSFDFYPEPTRNVSELVREKTGGLRYQHYHLTRDGVLVPWFILGLDNGPVTVDIIKSLIGKVLLGERTNDELFSEETAREIDIRTVEPLDFSVIAEREGWDDDSPLSN